MTVNGGRERQLRVSRRGFLKAGGAGAALATGSIGAVAFSSSRAFAQQAWDEEYDIVVVGSGGAGFAAATTAHHLGSSVIVLEKGTYVGGTTLVSGGGMAIPNSTQMQEAGMDDPRDEALKYFARYSWPHLYNPEHETLGLPAHDYDMISAYYDTAVEAMDFIEDSGAQEWRIQYIGGSVPPVPNVDYMDHFVENVPKVGRTLVTTNDEGNEAFGGTLIARYQAYAEANGIPVRLGHRAERVVLNDAGAVIGLEVAVTDLNAATPESGTPTPTSVISIRANKGVIFGSGGFGKNAEMMHHLMPAPYYGGCGAPTNEGDFMRISTAVGAKLGNLHNVWRNEGIYEQAVASPSAYNCIWFHKGDSMLVVNGTGRRFHNERRNYQDRNMAHLGWDPNDGTIPTCWVTSSMTSGFRKTGPETSRTRRPRRRLPTYSLPTHWKRSVRQFVSGSKACHRSQLDCSFLTTSNPIWSPKSPSSTNMPPMEPTSISAAVSSVMTKVGPQLPVRPTLR